LTDLAPTDGFAKVALVAPINHSYISTRVRLVGAAV